MRKSVFNELVHIWGYFSFRYAQVRFELRRQP